ncbi:redoxin domain-containing protein [Variovorax sp. OV329]|uniref:redoxin domain-containing protein n=1 Tax=Variovorax sp. OV329 TaxID=1882825 RepID=UPI0008EC9E02|nr:redoxin domain-containing protein [Variovorax sp. OV329]SFN39964.1 Peroxiredoxin [Variovorax sp. OV329]
MQQARQPALRPGDAAPAFSLPAANAQGPVSLATLRGRPFLIGFYRGLHCPFCRRQLLQLAGVQPALWRLGVKTIAVINTPAERARMYFRYRPTQVMLLCDPECLSHHAFGVPHAQFVPDDGGGGPPEWPHRTSLARFEAARINPGGELPAAMHPMQANAVLNAKDGFQPDGVDQAIFEQHGTQLVGHFMVDAAGIVGWARIEAPESPDELCSFPDAAQLVAAAGCLAARAGEPPTVKQAPSTLNTQSIDEKEP